MHQENPGLMRGRERMKWGGSVSDKKQRIREIKSYFLILSHQFCSKTRTNAPMSAQCWILWKWSHNEPSSDCYLPWLCSACVCVRLCASLPGALTGREQRNGNSEVTLCHYNYIYRVSTSQPVDRTGWGLQTTGLSFRPRNVLNTTQ